MVNFFSNPMPKQVQAHTLSFCSDSSKRAVGQTYKEMRALVFGDLVNKENK